MHTDELIRRAIIGDGAAFTELWDTYIEGLRSYLRNGLKNCLDDFYIDDICSRSFEKAFRQIRSYDPSKSRFPTWLKAIARNTALDCLEEQTRVRRRFVSIDDDEMKTASVIDSMGDGNASALEQIVSDEDSENLRRYIERLPELYREVARKRLIEGLQYKEIAEELDMELNTVRTRIRRAKGLIDKLKEDDEQ